MKGIFLEFNSTLEKAIDTYGSLNQIDMLHEEIGELLQAINKDKRKRTLATRDNVLEEIADVEIMLEQLKIMTVGAAHSAVEQYKREKLERLKKKLYQK